MVNYSTFLLFVLPSVITPALASTAKNDSHEKDLAVRTPASPRDFKPYPWYNNLLLHRSCWAGSLSKNDRGQLIDALQGGFDFIWAAYQVSYRLVDHFNASSDPNAKCPQTFITARVPLFQTLFSDKPVTKTELSNWKDAWQKMHHLVDGQKPDNKDAVVVTCPKKNTMDAADCKSKFAVTYPSRHAISTQFAHDIRRGGKAQAIKLCPDFFNVLKRSDTIRQDPHPDPKRSAKPRPGFRDIADTAAATWVLQLTHLEHTFNSTGGDDIWSSWPHGKNATPKEFFKTMKDGGHETHFAGWAVASGGITPNLKSDAPSLRVMSWDGGARDLDQARIFDKKYPQSSYKWR